VDGGAVFFSAPQNGASASLVPPVVPIVDGKAMTQAEANEISGGYVVTAFTLPFVQVQFNLNNTSAPVIAASASPSWGSAPLTVAFAVETGGGSGLPPSFTWNFGDGSAPVYDKNPTHTYLALGVYTATVTVTDSLGVVGRGTVTIVVGAGAVDPGALGLQDGDADGFPDLYETALGGDAGNGAAVPVDGVAPQPLLEMTITKFRASKGKKPKASFTAEITTFDNGGLSVQNIGLCVGGLGAKFDLRAGANGRNWVVYDQNGAATRALRIKWQQQSGQQDRFTITGTLYGDVQAQADGKYLILMNLNGHLYAGTWKVAGPGKSR